MEFLREKLLHGLWANLSDNAEKQGDGQVRDPRAPGGGGLGGGGGDPSHQAGSVSHLSHATWGKSVFL